MTGVFGRDAVRTMLVPSVAFALLAAGAYLLATAHVDWAAWRQATCMPDACFCEAVGAGTVRQVANTWSSLAFAWVAFVILGVSWVDRRGGDGTANANGAANGNANLNAITSRWLYPAVFAGALVVVGVGSAFYHASMTFIGQFFDVFGMYLIGCFILVYNAGRLRPLPAWGAAALYVGLNVVLAVMLWEVPVLRRFLFGVVIVVALLMEWRVRQLHTPQMDVRYLVASIAALALAFVIWTVDFTRLACDPTSVRQGHAIWHLLGAASSGLIFAYYRSERDFAPPHPR